MRHLGGQNAVVRSWFVYFFLLLFDMIVGQGHAAVLHHLLLTADVYSDGTEAVVLEEQLVEGALGEDEVVEAAAFRDVADVQVGSLAEEVLRLSHAVDSLVEGLAAIARVDDDGTADVVALSTNSRRVKFCVSCMLRSIFLSIVILLF